MTDKIIIPDSKGRPRITMDASGDKSLIDDMMSVSVREWQEQKQKLRKKYPKASEKRLEKLTEKHFKSQLTITDSDKNAEDDA